MKNIKTLIKEGIKTFTFSAIMAFIIMKFIAFVGVVPSLSMYPTIDIGDRFLVQRTYFDKQLEIGDIVVFNSNYEGVVLIKRLIGKAGDEIFINTKGDVYINDILYVNENVVQNISLQEQTFTVPENSYFFLGDNRANSYDSRYWDDPYITEDEILGKAIIKIYPLNEIGLV